MARKRKEGAYEKWIVDFWWTFPDGTRKRIKRRSPVQTRRGAERYEASIKAGLLGQRSPLEPPRPPAPLFRDFAETFMRDYARHRNKPSELAAKRSILDHHLKPVLGGLRLDEIGTRDWDGYKARLLDGGLKPKTVKNHGGVLRKILQVAYDWDLIDKVPKMEAPRVPPARWRYLDFENADKLLAAAKVHEPDWWCMFLVAMRTGMRMGELMELRWHDLDLDRGVARVERAVWRGQVGTPKHDKIRTVDLSPVTVAALRDHPHRRSSLVFCQGSGEALREPLLRAPLERTVRRAGVPVVTWHDFRHTCASHLVMRGADLRYVMEQLGHSSIQVTMRYAHLAPAHRERMIGLLDAPAPGTDVGPKAPK